MGAVRRRLGTTAAIGVVGAVLLATAAAPVHADPLPTPAPGSIGAAAPAVSPTPAVPLTPQSSLGGARLGERGVVVAPGAPAVPATTAGSWVVADADSGQILAAKDPHGRFRPASTLKTLLALTMAPRLDPNSTITADKTDENQEGTRVGMVATQAYKVDDLWYGLLLRSGNDAANALARGGGGTVEHGIEMMRAEAQRLQANDTTVVNPSGLDADGQFSSAYDLALFGRAVLARNDLRQYVGSVKHMFPGNKTPSATKQTSHDFWVYTENRLLLQGFDGAIGVKTGYTTLAQNTLIAAAERNGHTIIATLMYTPFGQITKEAGELLNWGFGADHVVTPVGDLVTPLSAAVTSQADNGFTSTAVNERPATPGTAGGAAAGKVASGKLNLTPTSRSDSLRWSAVAGSALAAILVLLGAARMVGSRRRYRRAGAYRY